jgi:hypothetical protein
MLLSRSCRNHRLPNRTFWLLIVRLWLPSLR